MSNSRLIDILAKKPKHVAGTSMKDITAAMHVDVVFEIVRSNFNNHITNVKAHATGATIPSFVFTSSDPGRMFDELRVAANAHFQAGGTHYFIDEINHFDQSPSRNSYAEIIALLKGLNEVIRAHAESVG